jgi:hypothetical protein
MRHECSNITDFLANLNADAEYVFRKIVSLDVSRNPVDSNRRNAAIFNVVIQASAVVSLPDGAEYLLHCGEDCGQDLRTADGHTKGSDRANELYREVAELCDRTGLTVRPGIIAE